MRSIRLRAGTGCPACLGSGYRGRTGMFEMMVVGPQMRETLLQRPTASEIRRAMLKDPEFISLKEAGCLKAIQGVTTLEEALRVAPVAEEDVPESQRITLDELCRRAGLSLDGNLERHEDGMVRTPPEEEGR